MHDTVTLMSTAYADTTRLWTRFESISKAEPTYTIGLRGERAILDITVMKDDHPSSLPIRCFTLGIETGCHKDSHRITKQKLMKGFQLTHVELYSNLHVPCEV